MKALQDELKSLRQLLEQQQQQKPAVFDPSSFQFPFWQPGHFPFSTPMHPGTTHGSSLHPAHEGSAPPAQKDTFVPNHQGLAPATNGGKDKQSNRESTNSISSLSTTISHESDHTTSAVISEPSAVNPHPLTSKVGMDTTAQQQHTQPVLVNSTNNGSDKQHRKKQTNKTPSRKNRKQHKISSPSPELQQSDQSDSSISLLSSEASTLSVFHSTRLSPNQLDGCQGDNSVAIETVRVPSNANLTTWVCPLCGGRSVIVDSSGTRQHRHRQPEKVKARSRSTQCNTTSYPHKNQPPRRRHHEKVTGNDDYDFSKPRYTPKDRSSGLHYNGDVSSNGSSGLHDDGGMPSNRSSGLHHGYTPRSGLQYNSDTPGFRSSALHYSSDTPIVRSTGTQCNSRNRYYRRPRRNFCTFKGDSVTFAHPKATSTPLLVHSTHTHDYSSDSSEISVTPTVVHQPTALHYSSDTPIVRSTGTQCNSRNRYYRRPRRNFCTFKGDSVTFAHPKATSTPLLVHSTHTHDYSSDSSEISVTPTVVHQPTDYIVVESMPRHHRRHHVRPHLPQHHHVDTYLMVTSSSDDDAPHHIASR